MIAAGYRIQMIHETVLANSGGQVAANSARILEPLHGPLGRLASGSATAHAAVKRNTANVNKLNCGLNRRNYAHHIWDRPGHTNRPPWAASGQYCDPLVRADRYAGRRSWNELAVDPRPTCLTARCTSSRSWPPYSQWHENPTRRIDSYVPPRGLPQPVGEDQQSGDHSSSTTTFAQRA